MRRVAARRLKIAAIGAALLALLSLAALMTLNSPWFQDQVRQRIVAELERAIGGRAELGEWVFHWRLLKAQFKDLTLHGTEPAAAAPLLQARSIEIGLKIVSFWKQTVDIQSLTVVEPRVNILVAADGSTNIPVPKVRRTEGKVGLEPILDWKIGKIALENATVQYADRKHELSVRGENLRAQLGYDFTGPRYQGQVSIQPVKLNLKGMEPFETGAQMTVGIEKNRIMISGAKFDLRRSHVEASGSIENLAAPRAMFEFTARAAVDEAAPLFRITGARQGTVELAGTVDYTDASNFKVQSTVRIRSLDVRQDGVHLAAIQATASMRMDPSGLELNSLAADVLGGRFKGTAKLPHMRRYVLDGVVEAVSVQQALAAFGSQLPPAAKTAWSGAASGPVRLEGMLRGRESVVTANVALSPTAGGIPIQGALAARYDGAARTLSFGESYFVTPGARLDVSGVLGERLRVQLASTNLDELLPAINVFSSAPVASLPVKLRNGTATFDGTVSGKLDSPQITGSVAAAGFTYAGVDFDSFNGQVDLSQSSLGLRNATLARGAAKAQIAGTLALTAWKPLGSSPVAATVTLSGAELSELLSLAGKEQIPVRGGLTASARISGTVDAPQGAADLTITRGAAYDEPFDRLQATVELTPQAITVRQAKLTAGPAEITASGSFTPSRPFTRDADFRDGQAQFHIASNDLAVEKFETLKRLRPDLSGVARVNLQGTAAIHDTGPGRPPEILLTALDGDVATSGLRLDGRAIGVVKATATTTASLLKVQLNSNFLNSNLAVAGQWRLVPGYPGEASAVFSQISLALVRDWLSKPGDKRALNFDGSAEGSVAISGPALEPRAWKASARLTKVEIHPVDQAAPGSRGRFTLTNVEPVVLALDKSAVVVSSAHFSGPSTDVRVTGGASIEPRVALDLRVNGEVNLGVLQTLTTDIETDGAATISASVRGPLEQPLVNGRIDVRRGSVHFADTPTGLSAVNGSFVFSGNQATIQEFSGTVGGGKVTVSGVVGFAGGGLSYRVDVAATDVRVRYPEGASTSANAELSLRGTTDRSTLSGTILVLRTGFNPRTDFSSILGKATEPVKTPSTRVGPLSGMHFDVRIETAPDISFESSLAQDIQVEGNLRLQGTPYNPVLLGRLNITQGEINFFGTKYNLNQGSITFANPVKLEPVMNVDLETRVQGIDVILTVSGPINKLNVTPRSDPPLEFAQVLALLATGSVSSTDPALAARQNSTTQSFTQLGAGALIGQVVANPVSSRLQRFFGVSKLKIDPQLTGVENNPQARLTLEQQVSRNLTFTYITNLTSSNSQIVRVEWALNRNWSLIAVRDENGLFGADILYKKSFK